MDLRALRYFVEVVRTNSFTRAAENAHVTQPTISKMVRQLEDELGGPLLLREGRGVQLTDAGQVVYERGLQVLAQAQLLKQEVAEVDGIARGELSVGIMPTAGHYMAPVIALFQQRYPGVTLNVQESGARMQRQDQRQQNADAFFHRVFLSPDPGYFLLLGADAGVVHHEAKSHRDLQVKQGEKIFQSGLFRYIDHDILEIA